MGGRDGRWVGRASDVRPGAGQQERPGPPRPARRSRRFTALTGTAFAGYRFPPGVIALAVWYYLRHRLSLADVAEWLAERGVTVHRSTIGARVQRFTPLYRAAARPQRRPVGRTWSVDETHIKVAGQARYAYRAIDEHGQVVDVYVSPHRVAADAEAFFRPAMSETEGQPRRVTTDRAGCHPPALAAALPRVEHATGKPVQQRLERDHQHRKGRPRIGRGLKTRRTARVVCAGHAFVRNLGPASTTWEPPRLAQAGCYWECMPGTS